MVLTNAERLKRWRAKLKCRAFDAIGWICIFCGGGDDLHAAHVLPTKLKGPSRGMDRRHRDVLANPDSYRPMCCKCHRTFDKLVARIKVTVVMEEPIPF
jgi:hypothetical protein